MKNHLKLIYLHILKQLIKSSKLIKNQNNIITCLFKQITFHKSKKPFKVLKFKHKFNHNNRQLKLRSMQRKKFKQIQLSKIMIKFQLNQSNHKLLAHQFKLSGQFSIQLKFKLIVLIRSQIKFQTQKVNPC